MGHRLLWLSVPFGWTFMVESHQSEVVPYSTSLGMIRNICSVKMMEIYTCLLTRPIYP